MLSCVVLLFKERERVASGLGMRATLQGER